MKPLTVPILFERDSDLWILEGTSKPRLFLRGASCATYHTPSRQVAFVRESSLWLASLAKPDAVRPLCSLPTHVQDREELYRPALSFHPRLSLLTFSVFQDFRLQLQSRQPSDSLISNITLSSIWSVATSSRTQPAEPTLWMEPYTRGFGVKGLLSASHPSWSPDGKVLAYARGGSLVLATVESLENHTGRWEEWFYRENQIGDITLEGGGSGSSDVMGIGKVAWRPDGREIMQELFRWNGSSYRWMERLRPKDANTWIKSDVPRLPVFAKHPCFLTPSVLAISEYDEKKGQDNLYTFDLATGHKMLLVVNADYPVLYGKV